MVAKASGNCTRATVSGAPAIDDPAYSAERGMDDGCTGGVGLVAPVAMAGERIAGSFEDGKLGPS
jgi:hypothetical protein